MVVVEAGFSTSRCLPVVESTFTVHICKFEVLLQLLFMQFYSSAEFISEVNNVLLFFLLHYIYSTANSLHKKHMINS